MLVITVTVPITSNKIIKIASLLSAHDLVFYLLLLMLDVSLYLNCIRSYTLDVLSKRNLSNLVTSLAYIVNTKLSATAM